MVSINILTRWMKIKKSKREPVFLNSKFHLLDIPRQTRNVSLQYFHRRFSLARNLLILEKLTPPR